MQKKNPKLDQFINEFAENYTEKLFYFCLKKTGNNVEAEDLTQYISLQIITALNKGAMTEYICDPLWRRGQYRAVQLFNAVYKICYEGRFPVSEKMSAKRTKGGRLRQEGASSRCSMPALANKR